jgi:hypothetical protein
MPEEKSLHLEDIHHKEPKEVRGTTVMPRIAGLRMTRENPLILMTGTWQ